MIAQPVARVLVPVAQAVAARLLADAGDVSHGLRGDLGHRLRRDEVIDERWIVVDVARAALGRAEQAERRRHRRHGLGGLRHLLRVRDHRIAIDATRGVEIARENQVARPAPARRPDPRRVCSIESDESRFSIESTASPAVRCTEIK